MTKRYLLACLGFAVLFWAFAPQPAHAWGEGGCNWNPYSGRNSNVNFRCNLFSGLQWNFNCANRPVIQLAPWYTYFPLDPHLTAGVGGAPHYPDWPQPFPPQPAPQGGPSSTPTFTPGYTPIAPRPSPVASSQYGYPQYGYPQYGYPQYGSPQTFQPVGYSNFQPPSYWYGR